MTSDGAAIVQLLFALFLWTVVLAAIAGPGKHGNG